VILAIAFPAIDPVALQLGPLAIRWYALAYVAGLLIGWRYCLRLSAMSPYPFTRTQIDDFLFWAIIGVIVGGRLGYVLFYNADFYLEHPLEIFAVWRGGMSFHGGFIGMLVAITLFSHQQKMPFVALADVIAPAVPIGLFFGRIANFINGELFGRASDMPWAMVFPSGGPEPRHPSQLYEAGLEGIVLFLVLWFLVFRVRALNRPGYLTGAFLAGYGIARVIAEVFRQPDAQIGFLTGGITLGQVLSAPLIIAGLWLLARVLRPKA
jgi:phosphatidylglycerol:prolipoprotein diacylglycerol transferase